MKKSYILLCLLFVIGISMKGYAQTDPGTENLKHQWTFDDGTPKDYIGNADGTLEGNAKVENHSLVLSGGYFNMPGGQIALSSYTELTMEIWFASKAGSNTGWHMLSYFGRAIPDSWEGTDYVMIQPARQDNVTRCAIKTEAASKAEEGVNTSEYDDGTLHQIIMTVTPTELTVYVDGNFVGAQTLNAANLLSNVSTEMACLGKSGYSYDPTWQGSVQKFSIYNKALSADNVSYLFGQGAETAPSIISSLSSLTFDSKNPATELFVSSINLTENITVQAPSTVTVIINGDETNSTTIEKNTSGNNLYVYVNEGAGNINDTLYLRSSGVEIKLPIFALDDAGCSTRLYGGTIDNILPDFACSSLATFGGWGDSKKVISVQEQPENVYCGTASIGILTNASSLDIDLKGKLLPNTMYKVKAMCKTNGTFHIGMFGAQKGPEINFNTNNEWQPIVFKFTTNADITADQSVGMYFNNCCVDGTEGYIDNWEMYISQDRAVNVSVNKAVYDLDSKEDTLLFTVTGENLLQDIAVSVPAGMSILNGKTLIPMAAMNDTVKVVWDGVTAIDGNIVLSSDTTTAKIQIMATLTNSSSCFTPKYTDKTNLIPDPTVSLSQKFGGWGNKGILQNPDSAFCGSRCGFVKDVWGSFDVALVDSAKNLKLLNAGHTYDVRAMVKTYGSYHFSVGGIAFAKDELGNKLKDIAGNDSITEINFPGFDTNGAWEQHEFTFTVDTVGKSSGMYFNDLFDGGLSGVIAYIDNMELYDLGFTGSKTISVNQNKVYFQKNQIVAELNSTTSSNTVMTVYNLQGAVISSKQFTAVMGKNQYAFDINLSSGVYVIKLDVDGKIEYTKLVK